MADDQRSKGDNTRETIADVLSRHPDAIVLAVGGDGHAAPWPTSLSSTHAEASPGLFGIRTLIDRIVAGDHTEVAKAFRGAVDMGYSRASVRLAGEGGQFRRLTFSDLRATDGAIVAVLTPFTDVDAQLPLADLLAPVARHGSLRQTHLGEVLDVDDGFVAMTGFPREHVVGISSLDGVHPEDQSRAIESFIEAVEEGRSTLRRWRNLRADGTWMWVDIFMDRIVTGDGGIEVEVQMTDVSEDMRVREALEAQDLLLQRMAQVVPVGLFQVEQDRTVVYGNDRLHQILGTRPATSLPDQLATVLTEQLGTITHAIDAVLGGGEDHDVEVEVRTATTGEPRRCLMAVRALVDKSATVTGAIVCVSDITETSRRLLQLERELIHHSFHDPLTGLPNRTLLINAMDDAVVDSRETGRVVAILLVDIDGFKAINDTLGHSLGDEFLRLASDRLRAIVRPADLVARVDGDEFAILMDDFIDPDQPRRTAEQVLNGLSQPFEVDGHLLQTGVSIGIATTATAPGTEELLRDADLAMHRAKSGGRGRIEIFEPEMHAAVVARVELEASLRAGIEENQFLLVYQPIHDLRSREVTSVEALVRWRHPHHGMVPPANFIPLAEETGLIVPLGRWVLEEACMEAGRWSSVLAVPAPRISVNLSARQLASESLVSDVEAALRRSGLEPARLILEITESVLMESNASNFALLDRLRALGVSLAIDDFGTGYSSLAYLEQLPVDIIKIDKAFVDRITDGGRHSKLINGILSLSHDLGLLAVAEGIETADQLHALSGLHCPTGQGYLFSRPIEADAIRVYLAAGAAHRPWPALRSIA